MTINRYMLRVVSDVAGSPPAQARLTMRCGAAEANGIMGRR